MLRDSHAPEDHGPLGLAVSTRHVNDALFWDTRQARHHAWRIMLHRLTELVELLGTLFNKLLVIQLFSDDDVHHAVEQRHVRARIEAHVIIRVVGHLWPAWVRHNERG